MTAMEPVSRSLKQPVSQKIFFNILDAAIESHSYRFARQAAEEWIKSYPGDLFVNLKLAGIMLLDGNRIDAIKLFEKLSRQDPQFIEAHQGLAYAIADDVDVRFGIANACAFALGAALPAGGSVPEWALMLRDCQKALGSQQYEAAETAIHRAIGLNPELPLAAILHLLVTKARQDAVTVFQLAKLYNTRWPDCLFFSLLLAEQKMDIGDETGAVNLLHYCAANDAAGQVPTRLWGPDFPYSPIWPDKLEITFDLPIPSEVAAYLGWNLLPVGKQRYVAPPPVVETPAPVEEDKPPEPVTGTPVVSADDTAEPIPAPVALESEIKEEDKLVEEVLPPPQPEVRRMRTEKARMRSIEDNFEHLARKFKSKTLGRLDGRFPMYVIFTSKTCLEKQYGPNTTALLDSEFNKLAETVRKSPGWGAVVYYPDDPECMAKFGLQSIDTVDAWKLKLSLADLDKILSKKGEMIGALLIVGGPDIVPYHHLPNPTDDVDKEVLSDNPYANRDANYFVPEWPVGRLPSENGPDAGILLDQVRNLINYHSKHAVYGTRPKPLTSFVQWLLNLRNIFKAKPKIKLGQSFGYTAAIWRRSSQAVFKPVGEPRSMMISPPECSGSFKSEKITYSPLGYYNLHGLEEAPEWYGQRDETDGIVGPDYPVALSPKDLVKNGRAPEVIFTEACYGANIQNKTEQNALALRFIAIGTMTVVGSTCVCYGSVTSPLIGADLLGYNFWKYYKDGFSVGESMMQAKIDLVREMNKRQGYLDGEDQKTLLTFVLYGDPLVVNQQNAKKPKTVVRYRTNPSVKMVCDRQDGLVLPDGISIEVMREVRDIVSNYLPGLKDGDFKISAEHPDCDGINHQCPTSELRSKGREADQSDRLLVTISKQVQVAQYTHRHYARLTLDAERKVVKMVVSR